MFKRGMCTIAQNDHRFLSYATAYTSVEHFVMMYNVRLHGFGFSRGACPPSGSIRSGIWVKMTEFLSQKDAGYEFKSHLLTSFRVSLTQLTGQTHVTWNLDQSVTWIGFCFNIGSCFGDLMIFWMLLYIKQLYSIPYASGHSFASSLSKTAIKERGSI